MNISWVQQIDCAFRKMVFIDSLNVFCVVIITIHICDMKSVSTVFVNFDSLYYTVAPKTISRKKLVNNLIRWMMFFYAFGEYGGNSTVCSPTHWVLVAIYNFSWNTLCFRYLREYEQVWAEGRVEDEMTVEKLAGNPVHAFHLMKRLTVDWRHLQDFAKTDPWIGEYQTIWIQACLYYFYHAYILINTEYIQTDRNARCKTTIKSSPFHHNRSHRGDAWFCNWSGRVECEAASGGGPTRGCSGAGQTAWRIWSQHDPAGAGQRLGSGECCWWVKWLGLTWIDLIWSDLTLNDMNWSELFRITRDSN